MANTKDDQDRIRRNAKAVNESKADDCPDGVTSISYEYGFAMEYPVQRHLRDIRFTLIGGGTSEILKLVIAHELAAG